MFVIAVLAVAAALIATAVAVGLSVRLHAARAQHAHERRTAGEPLETTALPALREAELLAAALRGLHDGIVVVAADGSVVARNAAAARYSPARHGDTLAATALDELLSAARRGTVGERDLQIFGPPREELRISAVPLRTADEVIGAAGVVHDLSESRRLTHVRRDFVANVSHELKTPIGALGLLAETLDSEVAIAGVDPAVLQNLVRRIAAEADRLARLVDDLLDLSMIEAQEAPERDWVPVAGLVREAIERVHAAAEVTGVPLRAGPVDPALALRCDRRQLLSALTNLLDNAVKFSEAGAPVDVTVDVPSGSGGLRITVRDRGVGIPARDLERVFERFYRVDRARSRTTGGTGLGLAIVRHIARAHGGDVTVESIEGEGSTFVLRFPREVPLASGAGADAPAVREAS